MEKPPQCFDICIVCALYEEASAVLDEFSARCGVTFTKAFRNLNQLEYRHATIQNFRGESLTVFVTWLSHMGPQRTALDLAPLLHEIRPRFVAMTGVCAGNRRKAKLGDLIVATDAYHTDEGKITTGADGQPVRLPETRTAGATTQVIQYVRGFDEWKAPVQELKRQQLKRAWKATDEPQCHIEVMASSMSVRADNPFPRWTSQYHRKTVGIDMEAATFYTALRDFPLMHGLVVKGVSDYGDSTKNDHYRDYARRASAIYLLYFIQEYVTSVTMPRRNDHQNQSQVGPPDQQESPHHYVGIHNNASGSINIDQSHVKIAGGNIYESSFIVNYPPDKLRAFKWTGSRRQLLAVLAGLAITGSGITWFALSHQTKAPSFITPVPLGTMLYTYSGHSDWVIAVAWAPDSKRIASASADKTVQVWNAVDGGQTYIYRGHDDFVNAVAWSPDGRRIASGSSDGTVQVWDAVNGKRLFTYRGHSGAEFGAQSVAWAPDGTRIASGGSDGTVQVWYAADGGQVFTYNGHAYGENALAWSPLDGKYIAFGSSDNTVQVWDASDGQPVSTYHGHSKPVRAVAWSPDGRHIASGSDDNTVQVWDASDGQPVSTYHGHTYWVAGVTWSPGGRHIASGSWDTTVRVWNVANGGKVYIYTGHSDPVNAVAWSPDGMLIASGSGFPAQGTVQVWGAG